MSFTVALQFVVLGAANRRLSSVRLDITLVCKYALSVPPALLTNDGVRGRDLAHAGVGSKAELLNDKLVFLLPSEATKVTNTGTFGNKRISRCGRTKIFFLFPFPLY